MARSIQCPRPNLDLKQETAYFRANGVKKKSGGLIVNELQQRLCLVLRLKRGYSELERLHAPSLHSFKEDYSTYGPLGGMDGSLQSKWEDMSTRSVPSVMMSSLSL